MANAEAIAKANDKRIGVIEKKMDALEKATRAAGNFAPLEKRVSVLESLVKALAASTKAGGGDISGKDVAAMKKILAENQKTILDLEKNNPGQVAGRVEKLDKQAQMLTTGIRTLTGRQEAAQKKIQDEQIKIGQKLAKQAQDINKANLLEGRLKILESQVLAALAK